MLTYTSMENGEVQIWVNWSLSVRPSGLVGLYVREYIEGIEEWQDRVHAFICELVIYGKYIRNTDDICIVLPVIFSDH